MDDSQKTPDTTQKANILVFKAKSIVLLSIFLFIAIALSDIDYKLEKLKDIAQKAPTHIVASTTVHDNAAPDALKPADAPKAQEKPMAPVHILAELIDDAVAYSAPDGTPVLQLINPNNVQHSRGGAWYGPHVFLSTQKAETEFMMEMPRTRWGDGMVFVWRSAQSREIIGHACGGIGYYTGYAEGGCVSSDGIDHSIAIEFDVSDNTDIMGDRDDNHVALAINGATRPLAYARVPFDLKSGVPVHAKVRRVGNTVQLFLAQAGQPFSKAPILSYQFAPGKLEEILGNKGVYSGFVAGNCALFLGSECRSNDALNHKVTSWRMRNEGAGGKTETISILGDH